MTADAGRRALRRSVAFLEPAHVALVEVRGPGAFAALDRILPCDLHLADGQARPTVLLDEEANVIADVTIARLEKRYLLFVDGLTASDVVARVRGAGSDVEAHDARNDAMLVSLHGPYAWELGAAWLGRSLAGIPPLALLRGRGFVVLRGGRTGEYGYEIVLSGEARATAIEHLRELGARFDLEEASLDALDASVLEQGGFVQRWIARERLSPFELQLQWRISKKKEHASKGAVDRRRASDRSRIAWLTSASELTPGEVTLDGAPVGRTLAIAPSFDGAGVVGVALLDRAVSHSGFAFERGGLGLTTASPPLVAATSLGVRPQTDAYATRRRSAADEAGA
jgi:glycine cleavage system aminomethyltransferase T